MIVGQSRRHKLFTLFGFPIYGESSALFLLVIFLLFFAGSGAEAAVRGLVFVAVAFVSIILHELGHAFAIRRLGYGNSEIVLHGMGGVCQWRGQANRRDRILIALAGPGAGLAAGLLALAFVLPFGMPSEPAFYYFVQAVLWINIGWSVFNLMPIWPLDGGHVLRYSLMGRGRSQRQTTEQSLQISMVTAGLLAVFGLLKGQMFIAVLLGFILYNNYQELQRLKGPPTSARGY